MTFHSISHFKVSKANLAKSVSTQQRFVIQQKRSEYTILINTKQLYGQFHIAKAKSLILTDKERLVSELTRSGS